LSKRFLLAAGLIIALVVPSAAFGGNVGFHGFFPSDPPGHNGSIRFGVKRVNGKNKRVKDLYFDVFRVNCTKSGHTTMQTRRSGITINAPLKHNVAPEVRDPTTRKWHFNDLVLDAVGRNSGEHLDALVHFQGEFRKHNKNKAVGTLEVTLKNVDLGSGRENCHGGPPGGRAGRVFRAQAGSHHL
jgi:hypothetical protein